MAPRAFQETPVPVFMLSGNYLRAQNTGAAELADLIGGRLSDLAIDVFLPTSMDLEGLKLSLQERPIAKFKKVLKVDNRAQPLWLDIIAFESLPPDADIMFLMLVLYVDL